jgi:anti-anti-sigma factor
MEITKKQIDSIDVFELSGKLDVTGSKTAQEQIIPALAKGGKLIIDMSPCGYVASSGLRVLLITAKQSAMVDCKTVIAGVQPMVWDVIVSTGFEDVLAAYPSVEDAVTALKQG